MARDRLAAEQGLQVPVVYNTNATTTHRGLRLLDRIVDVYLRHKYADDEAGYRYSKVSGYKDFCERAIAEIS